MNRKQRRIAKKTGGRTQPRNAPENLQKIIDSAFTTHQEGRFQESERLYRQLLDLLPNSADVHNNLGKTLKDQNKTQDAISHYRRALELNPDHAGANNNLANAIYDLGDMDEALACAARAAALKPDSCEIHNNMGRILRRMGRHDEAITCYQKALNVNKNYALAHNNLGNALSDKGDSTEAIVHFERAIALKPDYAEAHHNRASHKIFKSRDDNDLQALEALAAGSNSLPADKAPYIHFALAKAYEDIGDYPRAFEQMLKGNTLYRQNVKYNENHDEFFKRIAAVFDADIFSRFAGAGNPSSIPIFIVGMPRSGSTLVEQILSCHPQVYGADELTAMGAVAGDPALSYPEGARNLTAADLNRLGQAYLDRLPELGDGKTRLTDKLPGNFLRIGLIRLILPNARIIHTMRDPVDTCVSCYSTLFTVGHHYSYDLAELGRYYRAYSGLMAHWRSVLPQSEMLDVSYESVVNDLEGQARRMIEYCGLPWDERCLDFQKNTRAVKTASNCQVRKPLYRSSLQRWKRYKDYIGPLLKELETVPLPEDS